MQRVVALSVLSLVAAAYAQPQTGTKTRHAHPSGPPSPAAKKTAATATHKRASSAVSTGTVARTSRKVSPGGAAGVRSRRGKGTRKSAKAAPSYQLHPDPERYRQIQQALADKGYYKGQVNGEWGDDSVEALKKFQADRKIDEDGKINSLSLIGLGLGPKHDGSSGRVEPTPPAGSDLSPTLSPPAEPPSTTAATTPPE
jgi:peptidoglycan hydrolase-like protein with peptidoglycan-binding domain